MTVHNHRREKKKKKNILHALRESRDRGCRRRYFGG